MPKIRWPDDHPNAMILAFVEGARGALGRAGQSAAIDAAAVESTAALLDRIAALIDAMTVGRTRAELHQLVAQVGPLVDEAVARTNEINVRLVRAARRSTPSWPEDHGNAKLQLFVDASRQVLSRVARSPLADELIAAFDRIEVLMQRPRAPGAPAGTDPLELELGKLVTEAADRMYAVRRQLPQWPDDHLNAKLALLVDSCRQIISSVPRTPFVDETAAMLDWIEALLDRQWVTRSRAELDSLVLQLHPLLNETNERMSAITAELERLQAKEKAAREKPGP